MGLYDQQTSDPNAPGYSPYTPFDEEAERKRLQEEAQQYGLPYHESDLGDIARAYYNTGPEGGQGGNLAAARAIASRKYGERASNITDEGGGDLGYYEGGGDMGGGGLPYPERVEMPEPTRPSPYSSSYQSQLLSGFSGVGEADRNRVIQAILSQPETMGPLQQAQLFEQQKELLNAQRQQQQGQLQQAMAQRGLTGGALQAGTEDINQQFNSTLLGAQRDIALRSAQQNRADQMAALEMQNAMAQGDFQRMASVYQANQIERANTENFLRQAAELTQAGILGYNPQRLAQAAAQLGEVMDFYRFLELQRQFENKLYADYYSPFLNG
jgi:hypothetical protein